MLTEIEKAKEALKELYAIGLKPCECEDTKKRFEDWKDLDRKVFPNKESAKHWVPGAFREVDHRYGHAGNFYREYPLKDGRIVVKIGHWVDLPDADCVYAFYFK